MGEEIKFNETANIWTAPINIQQIIKKYEEVFIDFIVP